jgi:hypothetical protein
MSTTLQDPISSTTAGPTERTINTPVAGLPASNFTFDNSR